MREDRVDARRLVLLLATAFVFALAVRLAVVRTDPLHSWNGRPMIVADDGYFYAACARDLLEGSWDSRETFRGGSLLPVLTAVLTRVLPFSFEMLIFYMPAVIGSLIVLPILMIGRLLGLTRVGFVGALIASVGASYYSRTMAGYYDTDMLVIVLAMGLLAVLVGAFTRRSEAALPLITLLISLFTAAYPQGYVFLAILLPVTAACGWILMGWDDFHLRLLTYMTLGLISLPFLLSCVAAAVLYAALRVRGPLSARGSRLLLAAAGICFGAFVSVSDGILGNGVLLEPFRLFLFRNVATSGVPLHFQHVIESVGENRAVTLRVFSERVAGPLAALAAAVAGYILLCCRYRVMLLSLPFAALGAGAFVGGTRFTVWAVPLASLGTAFLIMLAVDRLPGRALRIAAAVLATGLALYPHLGHAWAAREIPPFNDREVAALDRLRAMVAPRDHAIAWWDFGYPIHYYTRLKPVIDGGRNQGDLTWAVSFILTTPDPASARNMARLTAAYTDVRRSSLGLIMEGEGYLDPSVFLRDLAGNRPGPSRTGTNSPPLAGEIYLVLPFKMLPLFPRIARFSNFDLQSGRPGSEPFYDFSLKFRSEGDSMFLEDGTAIDLKGGAVRHGGNLSRLKTVVLVRADPGTGRVGSREILTFPGGSLTLVLMDEYKSVLLVDDAALRSLFVRLFVFEEYEGKFLDPVLLDPLMKVYRFQAGA